MCEKCEAGLPQGARFCPACGQPAGPPPRRAGRGPLDPPLPGPERKLITVMFADFTGFTTFVSKMDVEEVHEAMGSIWARLDAIIAEHGGSVEKHMGDALMAFFGEDRDGGCTGTGGTGGIGDPGSLAGGQGPGQVARSAIAHRRPHRPAGSGARPAASEFRATGDTLNLACRLEQNAPGHGVLISHDTFRNVHGRFDVEAMPPLTVEGIPEPLQTYLVSRAKPRAVARQLRDIEGVSTDMVGRKSELERLQAILHGVLVERESHAVTILGEAGIGKSRLLQEFQHWAELLSPPHFWFFYGQATAEMPSCPLLRRATFLRRGSRFSTAIRRRWPVKSSRRVSWRCSLALRTPRPGPNSNRGRWRILSGTCSVWIFPPVPIFAGCWMTEQIRQRAFHDLTQFFSALSRGTASGAKVRR